MDYRFVKCSISRDIISIESYNDNDQHSFSVNQCLKTQIQRNHVHTIKKIISTFVDSTPFKDIFILSIYFFDKKKKIIIIPRVWD